VFYKNQVWLQKKPTRVVEVVREDIAKIQVYIGREVQSGTKQLGQIKEFHCGMSMHHNTSDSSMHPPHE